MKSGNTKTILRKRAYFEFLQFFFSNMRTSQVWRSGRAFFHLPLSNHPALGVDTRASRLAPSKICRLRAVCKCSFPEAWQLEWTFVNS